jgi:cytochrome P450
MTNTFDPFDADEVQRAWPLLSQLRESGPVAELAGGMRYITRYNECREVLRDTVSFSNAQGFKAPGVTVRPEERILGEMDPPQHTAVRRVMVTALTPKVVHAAEPFIRATADSLLRALTVPGEVDLVPAFTVALPNRVTVHLLGFPPEDANQIAAWAKELMESGFPATNRSERGVGFAAAFPDFAGYIDGRIAVAQARPDDSIVTRLLQLQPEGGPQVRALVRNLITGGLTTTSQLLGNLIHEFLTDTTLEARLRADARARVGAIEESLRLRPPIMFIVRGCIDDIYAGGCPVHRGERVIVGTASANRDERVFGDPDAFRPDRSNADAHLTFGYGPHVCPGATLARTVARVGLDVLFERFGPGTLSAAPDYRYENVPTFFETGPRSLRVRTTR